ncbi:ribonuclease H-like domain-containing protein [Tanacetum coccineum]|uniref:Ribonuclease H-like domain-containing protein n=1 Tax=Tanacetum coccineum TaxID=301880 RepID=A0ABQ5APZ0_9ASTR
MPGNITGINCVIGFCSSRFFNHNSNIKSYKLYIGWIIDSGASQHMTYTILNMFNVVEVSKLNMIVGHPNGTKDVVTHVGSLRLTDKIVIHDVLVVPGYKVSLLSVQKLSKDNKYRVMFDENVFVIHDSFQGPKWGLTCLYFFNNDEKESWSSEPYDDRRDKDFETGEGIDPMSSEGTENTCYTKRDESEHPDDSEPTEEAVCDIDENATLEENDKDSKGDDSFYQEFNKMFKTPNMVQDNQNEVNLRRYSRKTSMPKKFSYFRVDSKVKYNIDKQVNYFNRSLENFNFSTSLNKIVEPKTFDEALKDIRLIEAMNLEMEALNRNGTWVLTELPISRKPIGSKWVFKVRYKSTREVKRFKARVVPKDINNAFLYGDLAEDVYMTGYFDKSNARVCIEVLESNGNLYLSQRKYWLKLLADFGMLACKPCGTPIESKEFVVKGNKGGVIENDKPLTGINYYQKLVVVNELNVKIYLPVPLHCDDSSAIQIAANPVFHERKKHFEIELFFLREKVADRVVKTVKIKIGLRGNIQNNNPSHVLRTNDERFEVSLWKVEGANQLLTEGLKLKLDHKYVPYSLIKEAHKDHYTL